MKNIFYNSIFFLYTSSICVHSLSFKFTYVYDVCVFCKIEEEYSMAHNKTTKEFLKHFEREHLERKFTFLLTK